MPRRRRKEENADTGGGGEQRMTLASRRTRTEENAGVKEYGAGRTMLEPEEDNGEGRWCLRRRRCWRSMRTTE